MSSLKISKLEWLNLPPINCSAIMTRRVTYIKLLSCQKLDNDKQNFINKTKY